MSSPQAKRIELKNLMVGDVVWSNQSNCLLCFDGEVYLEGKREETLTYMFKKLPSGRLIAFSNPEVFELSDLHKELL